MPTREWVQAEYDAFEESLSRLPVSSFKRDPVVRRMLSLDMDVDYDVVLGPWEFRALQQLDSIGGTDAPLSSAAKRMAYYAQRVISRDPDAVVEIGGGAGQFYATLRLLGYRGKYAIFDLPGVQQFQRRYLDHVSSVFGIDTGMPIWAIDDIPTMCVSFYALGEFTDERRQFYVDNMIRRCPMGLILWNPGEYATATPPFDWPYDMVDEMPLTGAGNKLITW